MTGMAITREEVADLARQARLALSEEEIDHLAPQLDEIITAAALVQEVAAEGVPLPSRALALANMSRKDELVPLLDAEKALRQAPAVQQQRVRVSRISAED
jgi:aspartyl-tRNA(Asn)/glutamyl-tRNA(Gln) amidotransferase subunit C